MHRLQQHILSSLIASQQLRYARLKPAEVEGNLFMYHLRQLIKAGYVEKTPAGLYQLSAAGKFYADQLSLKTFTPRAQPRIVTLMTVRGPNDQWLLYRRLRQPLLGMVGFPYGKLHLGETIQQAARRELKEKTGLSADLTHRGDGYATIYQDGEPVSQILFHLFYGRDPIGRLTAKTKVGESFWADPTELPASEVMPTVPDLLALVTQPARERFFTELVYKT